MCLSCPYIDDVSARRAAPRARRRRRRGLGAGRAVLLLALDLDDFRRYNAERGYEAGDVLLERFAARLAAVDGESFALGADAFALVVEGTPEELWRRGAAALWALDPGSGGVELRCSFGAAVLADAAADTAVALAVAEDRLADQRNRAPSVAERYGELILAILAAQQPLTSEHAFDVAALAAGVAARLGVDPLDRGFVRRAAELHDVGKIAIDPAIVHKPGPLDDAEWAEMRLHTIIGDELLLAAPPLRAVAPLVRASHERWDGARVPGRHRRRGHPARGADRRGVRRLRRDDDRPLLPARHERRRRARRAPPLLRHAVRPDRRRRPARRAHRAAPPPRRVRRRRR